MGRSRAAVAATVALAVLPVAAADAATKTVEAGPFGAKAAEYQKAGGDANAYFRNVVTIRKGDRVSWNVNGFHSVTFAPEGAPRPGLISPDAENPITGVTDAAGAPFWFNGQARLRVNLEGAAPRGGKVFDPGTLQGSGLPLGGPPEPYTLRFKRKGTFEYFCVVHPGMDGKVRVVGRRGAIPSARQDRREARRQQSALLQRVQRLSTGLGTEDLERTIQAGNDRRSGAIVNKYFPTSPRFAVGETVTLRMSPRSTETHTFTFGPSNGTDAYVDQLIAGFVGAEFEPRGGYPSESPAAGTPSITPALHGNGFYNSGMLDRDPATPLPSSTRVTFGAPGTYSLVCLVHPFMRDTVTVTP